MKVQRVQGIGICILVVVAILCFALRAPKAAPNKNSPPLVNLDPDFQIDLIDQEAVTPGKVIHAQFAGAEVVTYTAKPDDAAVAVFTMHAKSDGRALTPNILDAYDSEGYKYDANVEVDGPVDLIVLKRGFSKLPPFVSVKIGNWMGGGKKSSLLELTKIAAPQRVVLRPSPSEAAAADKILRLEANDDHKDVQVRLVEPLPQGESENVHFSAVSFTPLNNAPGNDFIITMAAYYDCIDAASTRIDRIRSITKESEFVYKGAKVVQSNGKNFLWLPTSQTIGSVPGYSVTTGNSLPYIRKAPPPVGAKVDQEIDLRFTQDQTAADVGPLLLTGTARANSPHLDQPNTPIIEFLGISPSVEVLGLDSLKIQVSGPGFRVHDSSPHTLNPDGFFKIFSAAHRPKPQLVLSIPELKIRCRTTTFVVVSSRNLVAPVHHKTKQDAAINR